MEARFQAGFGIVVVWLILASADTPAADLRLGEHELVPVTRVAISRETLRSSLGPQPEITTVRTAKEDVVRRAAGPEEASLPQPGSWAVVLAGLLGVVAIARRRMSA
jgi:MYXO-CTERM domain-containing protein